MTKSYIFYIFYLEFFIFKEYRLYSSSPKVGKYYTILVQVLTSSLSSLLDIIKYSMNRKIK